MSKYTSDLQDELTKADAKEEERIHNLVATRILGLRISPRDSACIASVLKAIVDLHDEAEREWEDEDHTWPHLGFRTLLETFSIQLLQGTKRPE